ncbi:hypothetical protein GBAR_LOCUS1454 [Geodia barretti]|uniref:Uncharacterized protein n=1 Tax=Geodia barretti TaxID=519541 RepID=A0AA35W2Y2_GEOBA|nr:hypothetical protein GBAR_LOCUS1454 [Geodia barretti]
MAKIASATVKKYAKVAYTRFDMCVSTMFSPFAGVLYTVSELENGSSSRSGSSSRPPSRSSSRASNVSSSGSSRGARF